MLTISHENGIEGTNRPHHILTNSGFSIIEKQKYIGYNYFLWQKDLF